MGANNSMLKQETVTNMSTEILNKSISNFTSENKASINSVQVISVTGGSIKCGGNFKMSNKSAGSLGVLLNNTSQAAANIANAATAKAESEMSTKVDQANSGLPMLQFNNSMSIQNRTTNVKTILATVLETNIKNTMKLDNNNKQIINLVNPNMDFGGDCEWDQESIQKIIAQSTVEGAIQQLIDNKTLIETKDTMSSDVSQSNTFTLLGFIGGGIFGFIILIGIIYMIFKKKSDDK